MRIRQRKISWLAAVALTTSTVVAGAGWASGTPESETIYTVTGAESAADRTQLARSGVDVHGVRDGAVVVAATDRQASDLRAKGLTLKSQGSKANRLATVNDKSGAQDFPEGYEDYHNYDELNAEIDKVAADHGDLAEVSSVGKSHEGRDIPAVKISDNVGTDEDEPEVLFSCQQHAREILTREMCLRIINRLTDGYADGGKLKEFVDGREIWVVPTVNPDGAEYDIESGEFQMWRKNRQDTGTDLNRNWGYEWGCCGGSSDDPADETYRGAEAFSAPETAALRDFVDSRVVGGKQQITANIDFHTYGELVLWPYGHTDADTAPGLSEQEAEVFQTLGKQMADTNQYTPQQASDLYITDGDINDWLWGEHKIWSYTFEMYGDDNTGFYPEQSHIADETARNDKAVDLVLENADCIPQVAGQSCE